MSARGVVVVMGAGLLGYLALMRATGPRTVAKMPGDTVGSYLMESVTNFFSKVSTRDSGNYQRAYANQGAPYVAAIHAIEARYNMPHGLLTRLAWAESGFNPNARNPSGAAGMFQFMPATAAWLKVDPLNWQQAAAAAGQYLNYLHGRFKTWPFALAAYNWGEGNLNSMITRGYWGSRKLTNVPTETVGYVSKIAGADLVALVDQARGGSAV